MEGIFIKKVCHLTSVHQRYDIRIFEKECKTLAKEGYDVYLIVNDQLDDEIIDGVKIISTKFKAKNRMERIFKSTKKIYEQALKVDADIYHFHDPELIPAGIKLKKRGEKVIFDSHEHYPLQIKEKHYLPSLFRKSISKIYYFYETYAVKRFDAVIFTCTYNAINPFENRAKKTVFIDNLPILDEFYNKYTEQKNIQHNAICQVGSLTRDRGITQLIMAASRAKVKLILGGMLKPENYLAEVQNMPEFSCVDYRGFVKRDEVSKIYQESKIGLSTILNIGQYNKSDNLPTKVYEYMSMGLPVILSDSPYVQKVLNQYSFGIAVDPGNIEQMVDAILFLLNNPESAERMGKYGRLAIKEKFNWAIEGQKLIDLYESL